MPRGESVRLTPVPYSSFDAPHTWSRFVGHFKASQAMRPGHSYTHRCRCSRMLKRAATGARAAHSMETDRPSGYQHYLPHHRSACSPPHRRTRRTLASISAVSSAPRPRVAPTAGSHDPDERTCSQCKMSARAAGSRRL